MQLQGHDLPSGLATVAPSSHSLCASVAVMVIMNECTSPVSWANLKGDCARLSLLDANTQATLSSISCIAAKHVSDMVACLLDVCAAFQTLLQCI